MRDHQVPSSPCPACGARVSGAAWRTEAQQGNYPSELYERREGAGALCHGNDFRPRPFPWETTSASPEGEL